MNQLFRKKKTEPVIAQTSKRDESSIASNESASTAEDGELFRDKKELSMYREMGTRNLSRIYPELPDKLQTEIFCFGNVIDGILEIYDFSLIQSQAVTFQDVCALYGRRKALDGAGRRNYHVYASKECTEELQRQLSIFFPGYIGIKIE